MTDLLLRTNKHYYETVKGEIKYVAQLSLLKREEFKNTLVRLETQLQKHQEKTFGEALEADKMLMALTRECLELGGVDFDDCSLDMAWCFLFAHEIDGYYFDSGILIAVNYPKAKAANETLGVQPGKAQSLANVLGRVTAGFEDLLSTLTAIEKLPADLLVDVLEERSLAMMSSDERMKYESKKMAQEMKAGNVVLTFDQEIDPSALGF